MITGFPIALSYPHFFEADTAVLDAVEGLTPEAEKHESYFFIQPTSGLPVDLAFRFQINMVLEDISSIANSERFANLVLPLLWFEIVSIAARKKNNRYTFLLLFIIHSFIYILDICIFLLLKNIRIYSILPGVLSGTDTINKNALYQFKNKTTVM